MTEQNPNKILNNNEAHTDHFKLVIRDLRQTTFVCQSANIPGISQNTIELPNSINRNIFNSTKLQFDPLTITFKIDEDFNNYQEIHKWLFGLTSPIQYQQFVDLQREKNTLGKTGYETTVDGSLFSLTNVYMPNIEVVFANIQPTSLSGVDFDLRNPDILTATASFAFDYFYFKKKSS